MSMSGSKIREQVAHFLVDIHNQNFRFRETISKLPMRQLTYMRKSPTFPDISKLPMRQLT